ncbi:MAG: rRNA maturation RNase YbeY [Gammaproteobacteria bacterium]|nr:rRNA maturation RNase YbeY [Gammaproteobacteria bacterium]
MNKIILQKISKAKTLPSKQQFTKWVNQALSNSKKNHEVVIRLVSTKEITDLNKKYRKKNKPTNIISFPFETPFGIKTNMLGDLAICVQLVKQEAKLQDKTATAHFAHLTIHGVLHLLGYTHEKDKDAEKMEKLEIKHLKKLGFTDPYQQ